MDEPPRAEPPTPEEFATALHPAAGGRPAGRVRRLLGRRSRQAACATCGRVLGDDAEAARWEFGLRGGAICPQCQGEGWHYPGGAVVPVRGATPRNVA